MTMKYPDDYRFTKKPVTIEAFQMTQARREDNRDWPGWLNEAWNTPNSLVNSVYPSKYPNSDGTDKLVVHTLEGDMTVEWNDWIIRGVQGELYPCKPAIFEATYERAS